MAINYNWRVFATERYSSLEDYNDVIYKVILVCMADDPETGRTFSDRSTCEIPVNLSDTTFVSFHDLTDEQILNWCWTTGHVNKQEMEQRIGNHLTGNCMIRRDMRPFVPLQASQVPHSLLP